MSQEKHQMCSNNGSSGGGSRSSRRIKQNKAPQRGLGVEKLERIRMEEQRKNGVVSAAGPVVVVPLPPPPSNQYQSKPSVQFQPPSFSFTSASPSDVSSMSSLPSTSFGPSHPSHNHYSNPTPSTSVGGPPFGWSLGSMDGGGGGFNSTNLEHTKVDTEFASRFNSHLHHDFKPNWPPLLLMQWKQHQQHQFSSLMNTTLPTSPSSGLNRQIEPPSNQNTYSNFNQSSYGNYINTLCHDDKMLGMKRSWPFSLDNLPNSFLASPFGRSDESHGNGNPTVREGPSGYSRENSSELNRNKRIKENGASDGDFLSLGLSRSTSSSSSTTLKLKQPLPFLPPDYQELSKIELRPFQGNREGLLQHQYSFFPPKEQQMEQSISTSKGEVEDGVDLTLKL